MCNIKFRKSIIGNLIYKAEVRTGLVEYTRLQSAVPRELYVKHDRFLWVHPNPNENTVSAAEEIKDNRGKCLI